MYPPKIGYSVHAARFTPISSCHFYLGGNLQLFRVLFLDFLKVKAQKKLGGLRVELLSSGLAN